MENYIAYNFDSKEEIFLAFISTLPFASFEEGEFGTIGYIAEADHSVSVKYKIQEFCTQYLVSSTQELIPPRNWNAQWEASFKPVEVNDFCRIRADFHEPLEGFQYDIIINPKMAFGTGHHETTWMMMNVMQGINFNKKSVFDFGCGTGVLAILAEYLGAVRIDALDIELESYENTVENAKINNCIKIKSFHGELETMGNTTYDIILANINRHVLLSTDESLYNMLKKDGILLLSGILSTDVDLVEVAFKKVGFTPVSISERGNWRCIKFSKD